MNLYDQFMAYFEKRGLGQERARLLKTASGKVLEVGVGTGVNMLHYDYGHIDELVFLDLEIKSVFKKKDIKHDNYKVLESSVEALPLADDYFDFVVVSLVFCSVKDVDRGLSEIKRVLKKGGQILFIEHVLPESEPLKTVFDMATPVWKHLAGGCHLNRDFLGLLSRHGFTYELQNRFLKTAFISGIAYRD